MKFVSVDYDTINLDTFKNFDGIKVIVFDFDFTLYKGLEWKGYNEFFISSIRKLFLDLSDDEFCTYLKKYHITSSDRVSENTARLMIDLYGSAEKLVDFLKIIKFPANWKEARIFPNELLEELGKRYKLYILSNSARENIEFVSSNLGIELKFFSDILPNNFEKEDLSKMHRLREILLRENVGADQILMVGDSVEYDLEPARRLGAKTLLISD